MWYNLIIDEGNKYFCKIDNFKTSSLDNILRFDIEQTNGDVVMHVKYKDNRIPSFDDLDGYEKRYKYLHISFSDVIVNYIDGSNETILSKYNNVFRIATNRIDSIAISFESFKSKNVINKIEFRNFSTNNIATKSISFTNN